MTIRNPFSTRSLTDDRKEPYLQVFLLGFLVFFLIALPVMFLTGGYFVYYGDFNSQQIPFYHLVHDAVQNGELGWNWYTDLGANLIGSYSFYLMGSPFFWLSLLFPSKAVPFLMPWLLALKHGVAGVTSFAFIRRFVKSRRAAMIGALLYTYSGFQLFNLFFNHFQDVTAFFPLLLIAMEQRVNENRRGVFALAVGFMAMLNYYFFTGQAVFLILYFIVRCPCEDFNVSLRKFFSIGIEAVLGVMLSAFMLLPSCLAILSNNRVGTYLTGMDMAAYSDRTRLWRIIQSFFMIPDAPARPNLFQSNYAKWSSIGGYLPLFSMAGVIAFMSQKRSHWATRLTWICIGCAFIPVFNSMFYTFNSSYYARWYYMPILIMAMMTAYALEHHSIRWKGGVVVCGIMLLLFAVIACFPTKDSEDKFHFFELPKYAWYFWICFLLGVAMLVGLVVLLKMRKNGKSYLTRALGATEVCCVICCASMVYFGLLLGSYPPTYIAQAINGGKEITLLADEKEQFFRVDMCPDYDNYPMFWGYPSMRCFQSVVPTSIMDFYDAIGVTRDVASRADTSNYPIRGMLNVRYYFEKASSDKDSEYGFDCGMPGFKYLGRENSFYIYENEAYLPMGMAYDMYIPNEELEKSTNIGKEKIMLQALGLNEEQIAKYADILDVLPSADRYGMDEDAYVAYCKERRADCCDSFSYDSYGFDASITLEQPKMVFFSVPYEAGWSAEVNGKPVDVELVNYGFMAVRCEAGENTITFHYETPGLRIGVCITAAGGLLLLMYMLIAVKIRSKKTEAYTHKYHYDGANAETPLIHELYMAQAAYRFANTVPNDDKGES